MIDKIIMVTIYGGDDYYGDDYGGDDYDGDDYDDDDSGEYFLALVCLTF